MVKPTAKKETVRIDVPAAPRAAAPPQATVKLQQTQPLIRPPAAEVRTLAATTVPVTRTDEAAVSVENDPVLMYTSVAVLLFAIVTFVLQGSDLLHDLTDSAGEPGRWNPRPLFNVYVESSNYHRHRCEF